MIGYSRSLHKGEYLAFLVIQRLDFNSEDCVNIISSNKILRLLCPCQKKTSHNLSILFFPSDIIKLFKVRQEPLKQNIKDRENTIYIVHGSIFQMAYPLHRAEEKAKISNRSDCM